MTLPARARSASDSSNFSIRASGSIPIASSRESLIAARRWFPNLRRDRRLGTASIVRVALVALLLLACGSAFADPAPSNKDVAPVLDRIAKGDKAAIAELDKLAAQTPPPVEALGAFLARKHTVELADRRKVLEAIKAQVPDK